MNYQAVANQGNQILTDQDDSMPLVIVAVENLDANPVPTKIGTEAPQFAVTPMRTGAVKYKIS